MKHKGSSKKQLEIVEVNVDDLVARLNKRNEANASFRAQKKQTSSKSQLPSGLPVNPVSNKLLASENSNFKPSTIAPAQADATPPRVFSGEEMLNNSGREDKLRLRVNKKIQEGRKPQPEVDVVSGEENSMAETVKSKLSSNQRSSRRNYVERVSSATRAGKASGCSWKDVMCILMLLLVIAAAAFMKFQEEMFGSIEHMRLESDSDADFYEILGVPHSASTKEVKRAYRNKVMEVHPDQHPDCEDCEVKFIAATKAYETLMDAEKRTIYDQTRGSYEPILSDFSVSLTSFNYVSLVSESAHVWVIQVFDDLDPYSRHFAQRWDAVAGSELAKHIKFGRVNARRDRAVLSLLPMRARTFPTVMMFSRDTMPSLFSIADTSSKALKKWILDEVPSHIGESISDNFFQIILTGGKSASLALKTASVRFARIFDVKFKPGQFGELSLTLIDKRDGHKELSNSKVEGDLLTRLHAIKEQLVIPLTRRNVHDVCGSEDTEFKLVCLGIKFNHVLIREHIALGDEEVIFQPVVMPRGAPLLLDFQSSQTAKISADTAVSDIFVDDLKLVPIDRQEYLNKYLPMSLMDAVSEHKTLVASALLLAVCFLLATRVGPVQITIAVAFLSLFIGALPYLQSAIAYIRLLV